MCPFNPPLAVPTAEPAAVLLPLVIVPRTAASVSKVVLLLCFDFPEVFVPFVVGLYSVSFCCLLCCFLLYCCVVCRISSGGARHPFSFVSFDFLSFSTHLDCYVGCSFLWCFLGLVPCYPGCPLSKNPALKIVPGGVVSWELHRLDKSRCT